MASSRPIPNQGGGPTHNDAIQILEGTGIHIVGNQLVAAKDQNAAIQITQDFGAVGDLHMESQLGRRRRLHVQHLAQGRRVADRRHAIGNRFGRNSFYACPILKSTQDHAGSHRQRLGRQRHDRPGPDARLTENTPRLTRSMAATPSLI